MMTEYAEFKISGLVISDAIKFDEYEQLWQQLIQNKQSLSWWCGDCAVRGEQLFGELHTQVLDRYSFESIATYRRVCEQIPLEDRRDELTFSHHQIVAGEDKVLRDELLALAVKDDLSTRALGDLLRERKAANEATTAPPARVSRSRRTPESASTRPATGLLNTPSTEPPAASGGDPEPAPIGDPGQTRPQPDEAPEQPRDNDAPTPIRASVLFSVYPGTPPVLLNRIVEEARRSLSLNYFTDDLRAAVEALDTWEDKNQPKAA